MKDRTVTMYKIQGRLLEYQAWLKKHGKEDSKLSLTQYHIYKRGHEAKHEEE